MKFKNAQWIAAREEIGCCPFFRKEITLRGEVKKATLRASAMGMYRFYIDEKDVSSFLFMPGWTDYSKRLQVQTYDVTAFFDAGKGTARLSALIGNGWAAAKLLAWQERPYAPFPSFIAEMTVLYRDGTSEIFGTDESWEVWTSGILSSEIYLGEEQDATVTPVRRGRAELSSVNTKLIAQEGENIVEGEIVRPRALIVTPKGEKVIDFGQNLAGYVRVRCKGPRGSKISFVPAEILDKDGNFYNENYRNASSVCTYTLSGGEDDFKPVFGFQGFRYIRIDEYFSDEIDLSCFTAIAVHSDLKRTGKFVSGNEKINRLYSNIVWGQLSNYIDVPTDCPQRDERLGWMGDAQVFCRTAAINFDVHAFFRKWLHDLIADQHKNGGVDGVVPAVGNLFIKFSAGWGDAATVCPWEIYLAYGDKKLLTECFPAMCKWVEYMKNQGDDPYTWSSDDQFGDWLATDAPYGSYVGATDLGFLCTAFYALSTRLVIKAGDVLGKDVRAYRELYGHILTAFRAAYLKDGLPVGKPALCGTAQEKTCFTQTALALILHFGLGEEKDRQKQTDALVGLIEKNGGRMTTGFLGTPYLLHALSENGRDDVAYGLLLQEKAPSWLFSVNMGATTMWEHWDGINEKGDVWSRDMNSFNHYAYGAVFDWIFGKAVGITPEEPAYASVRIQPRPSAALGFTEMTFRTKYGDLFASWRFADGAVRYEYEIPAGMRAHILLPDGREEFVCGGKHLFFTKDRI